MALKAIISAEDHGGLSEELQAEYQPMEGRDGFFVLDVASVDGFALEDVAGLKSAVQKERQNVKEAQKRLDAFGELDPVAAKAALKRAAEMENWKPDEKLQAQIEERERKLIAKHESELAAANDTAEGLRKSLHTEIVESRAKSAIADAKGDIDLLLPHVLSVTKLAEDNGRMSPRIIDPKDGTERLTGKSGSMDHMTIEEFVGGDLKERFPNAYEGTRAGGSGASGSDGGSAGAGGFKITETDARDPQKYQAMREKARAAGQDLQIVES
jgi:hypothetical protein